MRGTYWFMNPLLAIIPLDEIGLGFHCPSQTGIRISEIVGGFCLEIQTLSFLFSLDIAGSVQYATCSQEADIVSIRREIGHNVHRVDHAIHVLLTAGMSTPALRDIARSVDIEHAAFAELAGAAFLLGPFELVSVVLTFADLVHSRCIWGHVFLAGVSLLSRLMLFVWLARSHWDEQRFILKVMNKYLFVSILVWLGLMLSVRIGGLSMTSLYFLWLLTTDLCLLFMLSIALLGVRGLARLPCGWRVLQILFSRGDYARNALKASWSAHATFSASWSYCRRP